MFHLSHFSESLIPFFGCFLKCSLPWAFSSFLVWVLDADIPKALASFITVCSFAEVIFTPRQRVKNVLQKCTLGALIPPCVTASSFPWNNISLRYILRFYPKNVLSFHSTWRIFPSFSFLSYPGIFRQVQCGIYFRSLYGWWVVAGISEAALLIGSIFPQNHV